MLNLTHLIPRINAIETKLHREPELSFPEYGTTRLIDETLSALPGTVRVELGRETGTVWRLKGAKEGPTVGLRADIDAIRQMISQAMPQLFNSVISVAGTLVSMIILSPALTAV